MLETGDAPEGSVSRWISGGGTLCGSVEEAIVGEARGRDVEDQRRMTS